MVGLRMFQIKNFVSIVAGALNYVRGTTVKITDLQPGSVSRTLIEAPAQEVEELYIQMFNGLLEAIPVATYRSFNFTLLGATYASGLVTVTTNKPLTQPITIPKGTVFTAKDGRQYASSGEMTWPITEATIRVPVQALSPGFKGNAAVGEINASPFFAPADFTISNAEINGGSDAETEADRMVRFASYIASLSRGTYESLMYALTTAVIRDSNGVMVEFVTRRGYDYTLGYNHLYIWSNLGAPSPALLARAQEIITGYQDLTTGERIPGYSAAGVRTDVGAMSARVVPMTFLVGMQSGYTLTPATKQSIRNAYYSLLGSVQAGEILRPDDVKSAALQVAGIEKVTVSMSANITCGQNEVLTSSDDQVTISTLGIVLP